jgi:2,3-bisphosphoglycerate-dependent phosphoglycerate mutase
MAYLILLRHGKSEWNKRGLWTGTTDVELTDEGRHEAKTAGSVCSDIRIDVAHTSKLKRAKHTLFHALEHLTVNDIIEIKSHDALNERDYGDYTGKNKWEIKDLIGDDAFYSIRRGWDTPIPNGETLKDVYARVAPYFDTHILPDLLAGKNVAVVAHGNSLRALIKHLEKLDDDSVFDIEVGTGEVHCYQIDTSAGIITKEIRAASPDKKSV